MDRWTRALITAVITAAMTSVAPAVRADDAEVVAQTGDKVWYAADVTGYEQDTYVNQCDQDLAKLVPGVAAIITAVTPYVMCTYRIPYGEGILQEYLDQTTARASAPPSQRRSDREIWDEVARRHPARAQCARGFAAETKIGVDYVECVRRYRPSEACPRGGGIRVPDGRLVAFTDTADERKCSRDTATCPAGASPIPRKALPGLDGCYRCPAGELDAAETVAWRKGSEKGQRVLCKARKS